MNFRTVLSGATGRMDDRRLLKRVRSELGRVSSQPREIDVEVRNGSVALRGPVVNCEVIDILAAVESVPGVRALHYELEGYDSFEEVPSRSGGIATAAMDLRPRRWAPVTRAAVAAGLIATSAWAMKRARA